MQTTAKITELNIDYNTRKPKISLILDTNDINVIEELKNENKLNLELKKYYKKRSLDANAYMWVLIGKIADKLNVSKEEVYKDAIKQVGAYTVVPIKDEAVEEWIRIWQGNGLGWICEMTNSKLKGFVNVLSYHGSSTYNSKEMSRLVDLIVNECKELDIETMTPEQLSILKENWK